MKVFLVEDEFVVREGIKNNIDWEAHGYEFCGEAGDGEVAYPMIQKLQPDIVITDIKMPFMDGLTLSRMIKEQFPWIEIILLTGYEDFQFAQEAIRIGVSSYLSKPISGENLLKEIDNLAEKTREKRREREVKKRYEEEMQERTEYDRQELFADLVAGTKGLSEILDSAKKLSLDLTSIRYNVIRLKVWSTRHDAYEYSQSVVEIEKGVRGIAEEAGAIFFDLGIEGAALLFKGDDDESIGAKIEESMLKMKELFEKYHHIKYFGGVGQCVGRVSDIPVSFSWASRAFAHMYLTDDNGFLIGQEDMLHPQQEDVVLSEIDPRHIDRRLIREFLRRGDTTEAEFFIEEFINGMGKGAIRSTLLRQYIAMDVYFCVTDFMENELHCEEKPEIPVPDVLADEGKTQQYMVRIVKNAAALRENDNKGHYRDVVNEVMNYIEAHYTEEDLSLNTLAAHVNFSPNHLSAVFRQQTGQPFIKYLTDYRMNAAKELLSSTSKKSNEIGLMVGYKDPHYFSYLFKKTQGVTPTQYRGGNRTEEN
ncbi:response regulator [Butyrivibrio sp. INlla16]|uniref:response regulator transcription factor n=1 Tax=Butyrivibrio sp. INlla16 TaxID=1520807 RepID=UPI0008848E0C|nr:response regulator [Butyrivibrio sp. INlla16]SDB10902.1 two-component system, response regulator YesN [Butyrivibrio sp. INlla16]